jgi:hypothetical protein
MCIPRKGIAWPQLQFPRSCVCEQFICSQDRSTYFPAHRHMNVEIGMSPRNSFSRNICFEFSVLSLQFIRGNFVRHRKQLQPTSPLLLGVVRIKSHQTRESQRKLFTNMNIIQNIFHALKLPLNDLISFFSHALSLYSIFVIFIINLN